jgi:hypothetical protein
MKYRNNAFIATTVALALAFAPGIQAGAYLEGGPDRVDANKGVSVNSVAGVRLRTPADVLAVASISFAPIGLTLNQTARVNLLNTDVGNGITVSCRFIDASGSTLAQSVITLSMGKTTSVDYKRQSSAANEAAVQLRAEVRVRLDILTYGVASDSLRQSLEVFDNNTGETTVYMAGGS